MCCKSRGTQLQDFIIKKGKHKNQATTQKISGNNNSKNRIETKKNKSSTNEMLNDDTLNNGNWKNVERFEVVILIDSSTRIYRSLRYADFHKIILRLIGLPDGEDGYLVIW